MWEPKRGRGSREARARLRCWLIRDAKPTWARLGDLPAGRSGERCSCAPCRGTGQGPAARRRLPAGHPAFGGPRRWNMETRGLGGKGRNAGLWKIQCCNSPARRERSWAETFIAAKAGRGQRLIMPSVCLGWVQSWSSRSKGLKFFHWSGDPSCVPKRFPFVWCVQINIFKTEISHSLSPPSFSFF